MLPEFDSEFASPADYAKLYRQLGMQVVPAYMPNEAKSWKRPFLQEWKQYTHELVSQEVFDGWYGAAGKYSQRSNMGLITGVSPGRIVVVDLDTHKNPKAQIWWEGVHADHNAGIMSECPTQRTGGGGYQMFFRAPEGWNCPTCKNSELGVDIRGVGGFAMLPPSKHESGKHYDWLTDQEPDTIEIPEMPKWLCDEIDSLGATITPAGERIKTATPEAEFDEWGKRKDGRESLMHRMIFRKVIDLYRDAPIIPTESEQTTHKKELFESYVESVEARIHEPGTPKHMLLERENRGITLFNQKWRAAIKQWDTKIADEAGKPQPYETNERVILENFTQDVPDIAEGGEVQRPPDLFRVWDIEDLRNMPPPVWLWEGIIVEGGSHFFAAAPGVGKTFVGMGLGVAVATGMDSFLGRKVNTHGLVIYITTEGLYDHYNRISAFEDEYGVKLERKNYIVIPDALNLMREPDRLRLMKTLSWEINYRSKGKDPALIIYDTISKVIPGADENGAPEMSIFNDIRTKIRQAFNSADIGMHHVAKNGEGGMRGSSALIGDGDSIMTMDREKGSDELIMTAYKIKAAPDGWSMTINMKTVSTDGFKTSLVPTIQKSDKAAAKDVGFGNKQETGFYYAGPIKMPIEERDRILASIKEDWDANKPWSMARNMKLDPRHAYRRLHAITRRKLNESNSYAVISALVDSGFIAEQVRNKDTKMKGLKIIFDPRNVTEVNSKNSGSGIDTSGPESNENND